MADAFGDDVLLVPTDITDDAQLDALAEAAVSAFGGIDVLVNAAATYH